MGNPPSVQGTLAASHGSDEPELCEGVACGSPGSPGFFLKDVANFFIKGVATMQFSIEKTNNHDPKP